MILHNVYFSPKGTTKKCAQHIASNMDLETKEYDWLKIEDRKHTDIPQEDVLLLSMPVYGGFIPKICLQWTEGLKGHRTSAVIAAIYGNRHYDNALLQMKDILEKQGFLVIAAGAFLAEHSIFTHVASGRPDEKDEAAMKEFAAKCRRLLEDRTIWEGRTIEVPGKADYDAAVFQGVPFKPEGDETCVSCGKCVEICPNHAIAPENPRVTKAGCCISCGACIRVCPTGARNYRGDAYKAAGIGFAQNCMTRREAETFYIR